LVGGAGIGAGSEAVVAVLVCDDGLLQAVNNVLASKPIAASARKVREP
jgi:hypothetical protein